MVLYIIGIIGYNPYNLRSIELSTSWLNAQQCISNIPVHCIQPIRIYQEAYFQLFQQETAASFTSVAIIDQRTQSHREPRVIERSPTMVQLIAYAPMH